MSLRTPLVVKFITPLIVLLVALGFALNAEVSQQVQTTLLNQAASFVVNIVQLQAARHGITTADFTSPPTIASNAHLSLLTKEIGTKGVIRTKVWNMNYTVLFSDDKTLVGKRFPDDDNLIATIHTGLPHTELVTPTKQENLGEKQYSQLLEIYIPIFQANKTASIGVVETYYDLTGLFSSLNAAKSQILITIIAALSALAVILFAILYVLILLPLRQLGSQARRIGKGKFDLVQRRSSNDEIGDLFGAVHHMSKDIERLQQLKNEFVYVAAHELRAPVTVIKGNLSMLSRHETNAKDAIADITSSNARLEQLVDDLLEIARSDSGKLNVEVAPTNLSDATRHAVREFEAVAKGAQIKLIADIPAEDVWVLADVRKLGEVLANLISNAIKYGRPSGFVLVTLEQEPHKILLSVQDNGHGISAPAQRQLFGKFYRAPEAAQSDVTGTGLGLYITKELVTRMKGKISFTSKPSVGTTFHIVFQGATPPARSGSKKPGRG